MKNLENQVAQQAVVASRQQGQLPPKPEQNPKEQDKATVFLWTQAQSPKLMP
jgi:hypothetical protein